METTPQENRTQRRHPRAVPIAQSDPLFSPPDAGQYLGGVAAKTLANWRNAPAPGRSISFVKVGGRVFYRKSALDSYLTRGERAAA
jgi:hypothetical protein